MGLGVTKEAFIHFLINFFTDLLNLLFAISYPLFGLFDLAYSILRITYFKCRVSFNLPISLVLWSISSSLFLMSLTLWLLLRLTTRSKGSFCSTTTFNSDGWKSRFYSWESRLELFTLHHLNKNITFYYNTQQRHKRFRKFGDPWVQKNSAFYFRNNCLIIFSLTAP